MLKDFNNWLGESEEPANYDRLERADLDRLGAMGLDDRQPREIIADMMTEWFEDAEVYRALKTLNSWMDRRLGKGVNSDNVEDWAETLSEIMTEFDIRNNGVFEIILMETASDSGIDF